MKKKNMKLSFTKETISKLEKLNVQGGVKGITLANCPSDRGWGTTCDSVYMSCDQTIYRNCQKD
ncbi:MAG: hypothetical protein IPH74_08800 [Bacteroidetes bacterium]|jgi:hypothetical protein|nr:hypothetical protein [Bacteroidota bacterium]MBP7255913.1 hypothetical protein [Chitinophagales bacterium]MBK7139108.1 hypothetical protein [Bacteroidota bacterium]MBK7639656.1 hypothetical protein [Bacteroidota bacterium]MBK8672560.1 hypothetical protein [Bacteroidota bacterium]